MLFKNKFFNKYLAFIFVITFLFVIDTVHAYPDMKEQGADETASESTDNSKEEKADPKNLKECKMQAKSKKDAKDCEKKFMKTIDEFIEEEELTSIEGYLKIFTNDDNSEYYLQLDAADLNSNLQLLDTRCKKTGD